MNCQDCERIKNRKNLIYEDEIVSAFLSDNPATAGHIEIYPKEHQPIIEKIPDNSMEHMLVIANKLSALCFEVLEAHGTNIIINNGIAAGQNTTHAKIQVIPRMENDGLSIHWQTIKENEEDLKTTQLMIKSELEQSETKKEEKEPREEKKEEVKEEIISNDEENYLIKQLERIP